MITFPEQPDTEPFKDDDAENDTLYTLRQPYTYVTLAKEPIIIPAGFKTDEVSIPSFMWTILRMAPDGYYRAAGVVHDYLYSTGGENDVWTRKECDKILLEILLLQDVAWFRRRALYLAVRLFGHTHWKTSTK